MSWMKNYLFLILILIPVLVSGQTLGEIEETDYDNAVAAHFNQDIATINKFIKNGIAPEAVPVLLFISEKISVPYDKIIALYKGGQSWQNIVKNNNASNDIFYFSMISGFKSETFLPIFEKFKAFNAKAIEPVMLDNVEIINIVNLQFLMKFYDFNVCELIAMRDYGKSFIRINADVKLLKDNLNKAELAKEREEAKLAKEREVVKQEESTDE